MKRGSELLQRASMGFDLSGEPIYGMPLIEIYGNSRILIENHKGIKCYGCCKITVCSKLGDISINGNKLNISSMSKYRLVIVGLIESVSLVSRR